MIWKSFGFENTIKNEKQVGQTSGVGAKESESELEDGIQPLNNLGKAGSVFHIQRHHPLFKLQLKLHSSYYFENSLADTNRKNPGCLYPTSCHLFPIDQLGLARGSLK